MLKFIFAIPLIAHGLANLAGVFAPWQKTPVFKDAAWIFSKSITYSSWAGRIFSLFWLASSLCLIASGAGMLAKQPWWLLLGIVGCAFSLVSILPWIKAVPPGAYFGAFFDVVVILLLVSPLGERIAQAVR